MSSKKTSTSASAAIALAGSKGGGGKTTFSQNIAPLLLNASLNQPVKIIEIDNNNTSLAAIDRSEVVSGISLRASGSDLDQAVDEAVLAILGEGMSVVLDFGGGDDSARAMAAVGKEVPGLEVFIPITADFQTVSNVVATAKSVPPGVKKVLIFSNYVDLKDDFWFIFGSVDFGIEPNFAIFDYFDETIEVPNSRLFGLAKLYQTTLLDLANISKSYDYAATRMEWVGKSREFFSRQMSRHRLSVAADEFLDAVKKTRKEASSWT